MGGFFGVAAKEDCVFDLFFGVDYHSHLGTRRAGMAVYDQEKGFDRAIHNIVNAPFRTKFDREVNSMQGSVGIGCISDFEPQPLIVRSHHGTYAITTVEDEYLGKCANTYDNKCILLTALRDYLSALEGQGVIRAGSSGAELDAAASRACLLEQASGNSSEIARISALSNEELRKEDTGSHVFLQLYGKVLDAMEDFHIILQAQ